MAERGLSIYRDPVRRVYPDWMELKWLPCKHQDDIFFPDAHQRLIQKQAIDVCHTCPFIEQCAEYAITNYEEFGIWGGTTQRERERIRRRRGMSRQRTA